MVGQWTVESQSNSRLKLGKKITLSSCLWFDAIAINLFGERIVHFCLSFEGFTWLSWHSDILDFSDINCSSSNLNTDYYLVCWWLLRFIHFVQCLVCMSYSYWMILLLLLPTVGWRFISITFKKSWWYPSVSFQCCLLLPTEALCLVSAR